MTSRLAVICAATLLSGCAMTNPYVLPYSGASRGTSDPWHCDESTDHPAVCRVRTLQGALARHLRDHTQFGAITGSLLLPLAGLIAYKGATGGGNHNIAALSSAGFSGYGITQYLYKRPRELIYVSGISALDCAISLAQPYLWTRTDDPVRKGAIDDIEELRGLANRLDQHLRNPTDKVARDLAWLFVETDHRTRIVNFHAALASGIDLIEARLILSDARRSEREQLSEQVAAELAGSAYRIIGLVNQQLAFLAPDPAQLQSQLSTLTLPTAPVASPPPPSELLEKRRTDPGQMIPNFRKRASDNLQVAAATASAQAEEVGATQLSKDRNQHFQRNLSQAEEWLNELERLLTETANQLDTTHIAVTASEAQQPPPVTPPTKADWERCGVEMPGNRFDTSIALDKSTLALVAGNSGIVLATGGSGTPVVRFVFGPPTEHQSALTYASTDYVSGVARVTVASTSTLPAGTYAISIDNATLRVDVSKAASP